MTRRRWLAAIVVIALGVRVALVLATPGYVPKTDAVDFDRNAVSLVEHGSYASSALTAHGGATAIRPPLLPFLLGGVYEISGTSPKARWEAGRMLEAVLGAVAVLLIGLIGERLFGRAIGLLAAGIAAVYPPLVMIGSSLLSEAPFIPLALASVWAALRHRDSAHRVRWAALSGALLGAASLARGNGLALIIPIGFLVWDARPRRSWRSLRAPLAMVAATVVVLIPWTVRNYGAFHELVPITTETGYAVAGTYNPLAQGRHDHPALWIPPLVDMVPYYHQRPYANEAQVSGHMLSDGLHYIGRHPVSLARTAGWTFLRLFNFEGAGFERYAARFEAYPPWLAELSVYVFWLVLGLAIVGAFTAAARRAPPAIWACPLVIVLSVLLLEGSTRYRSPADPFFLLAAALGLVAIAGRLGALRARGVRRRPVASASA